MHRLVFVPWFGVRETKVGCPHRSFCKRAVDSEWIWLLSMQIGQIQLIQSLKFDLSLLRSGRHCNSYCIRQFNQGDLYGKRLRSVSWGLDSGQGICTQMTRAMSAEMQGERKKLVQSPPREENFSCIKSLIQETGDA